MSRKHIHIISFDIPYPANYGGIIDVFHKIRLLHQNNVEITLHCFQYRDKQESQELEKYCKKVFYYKRKTGLLSNISSLPYIVKSRKNKELIQNLLQDNDPILFEGKHCCYYLNDKRLKNRLKLYRACNIEYEYYTGLYHAEKNRKKKLFFYIESKKLKLFSKHLKHADVLLGISEKDTINLKNRFPEKQTIYLPAFHPEDKCEIKPDDGKFILYHGNLSVPENEQAVTFLIDNIFAVENNLKLIVAGLNPSDKIKKRCDSFQHIDLIENPTDTELKKLIQKATVNLLYTSQPTGIKLKLLAVLFNGKHCIVNQNIIQGTGLENVCTIANTPGEITHACKKLSEQEFTAMEYRKRQEILDEKFSNQKNIDILLALF